MALRECSVEFGQKRRVSLVRQLRLKYRIARKRAAALPGLLTLCSKRNQLRARRGAYLFLNDLQETERRFVVDEIKDSLQGPRALEDDYEWRENEKWDELLWPCLVKCASSLRTARNAHLIVYVWNMVEVDALSLVEPLLRSGKVQGKDSSPWTD